MENKSIYCMQVNKKCIYSKFHIMLLYKITCQIHCSKEKNGKLKSAWGKRLILFCNEIAGTHRKKALELNK